MLGSLENRLTAQVAEALSGRTVAVVSAPLPLAPPVAGERSIRVSLDAVTAASNFEVERTMFTGAAPDLRGRRVVQLSFTATVSGVAHPAAQQVPQVMQTRQLLLEDLSLVLHALDGSAFRTGADLDAAGDPGYDVLEFRLASGTMRPELVDNCVAGALEYQGTVRIWPPGVSDEGTEIRRVDTVLEALPVDVRAVQPVLRAGAQTLVRVKVTSRIRGGGAAPGPLRLAATVLGDVPPSERGSLASGTSSPDAGFALYSVTDGAVNITYVAPTAGLNRPRTEYVSVHLATPDGRAGLLLGSTPIRVLPVSG